MACLVEEEEGGVLAVLSSSSGSWERDPVLTLSCCLEQAVIQVNIVLLDQKH